jgi:hypothetical protein
LKIGEVLLLRLTTNDEFGTWKKSGKVVFGAPEDAWRVKYQLYYADKYNIPTARTLEGITKQALLKIQKIV